MVEFFRLKAVMFRLKERMQSEGILSRKINTILKSKKKGSGILRREICGKESKEYLHWEFNRLNCITVLLENQGEVDRTNIEIHMGIWGKTWLQPEFKNFLFRYCQCRITTNQARARFVEQEPYCTFCKWEFNKDCERNGVDQASNEYIFWKGNLPHESIFHLFWECPESKKIINAVKEKLLVVTANLTFWLG